MTFDILTEIFSRHPLFNLFRKQNPALPVSFLYETFKRKGVLTVLQDELLIDLEYYLEEYDELPEDSQPPGDRAGALIAEWCSEKLKLLRRYRNEEGFWILELTPVAEKSIQWLEELSESVPVAAESRFTDILERLENLVSGSQKDPELRIQELKDKKREIEKEIREIEGSGEVMGVLDDRQVNERLWEIVRSSRSLIADFSTVEEDYRNLLADIYREEAEQDITRGQIVGTALTASEKLDATPQGQSFRAFWQYLISDYGGNRIGDLVSRLDSTLENGVDGRDAGYLREFKNRLFESGRKIVETNRRLGERLQRILESHEILRSRRLLQDIRELRKLAAGCRGDFPKRAFHLSGTSPSISLPLERPLSLPEEKRRITSVLEVGRSEMEDWALFSGLDGIDLAVLEGYIEELLSDQGAATLEEVLRRHPPDKGLSEIMGYFRLAVSRSSSRIDSSRKWTLVLPSENEDDTERLVTLPEVIYG
jgi:hypothetical protein